MAGIIAYPMASPEMGDLLLGTEIKEEGSAHLTKNFAMDAIRVLFAQQTPIQFTEVLVATNASENIVVNDGEELILPIGPAQVNINNPVSLANDGTITFNDAGLYTINATASFGTGSDLIAPIILLLAGFHNDTQFTPTYSGLAQYRYTPNVQHYNITKAFEAGDTFDFRLGKNGMDEGGLFASSDTNPFEPIPTFSVIVEQIKLV
jgi:hypothetical protein